MAEAVPLPIRAAMINPPVPKNRHSPDHYANVACRGCAEAKLPASTDRRASVRAATVDWRDARRRSRLCPG